jgi:hypothetical protein
VGDADGSDPAELTDGDALRLELTVADGGFFGDPEQEASKGNSTNTTIPLRIRTNTGEYCHDRAHIEKTAAALWTTSAPTSGVACARPDVT